MIDYNFYFFDKSTFLFNMEYSPLFHTRIHQFSNEDIIIAFLIASSINKELNLLRTVGIIRVDVRVTLPIICQASSSLLPVVTIM